MRLAAAQLSETSISTIEKGKIIENLSEPGWKFTKLLMQILNICRNFGP